jgi:hypothetical protein
MTSLVRAAAAALILCGSLLYPLVAVADMPVRARATMGVQTDGRWTLIMCSQKENLQTVMDAARLIEKSHILSRADVLRLPTCERMSGYMNITAVYDTYGGRKLVKVGYKPYGEEDRYSFDWYYSITAAKPHRNFIHDRSAYRIGKEHEKPFYGTLCTSSDTVFRQINRFREAEQQEKRDTMYDLRQQRGCDAYNGDLAVEEVLKEYQYGPAVTMRVVRVSIDVYHDGQEPRTFYTWMTNEVRTR